MLLGIQRILQPRADLRIQLMQILLVDHHRSSTARFGLPALADQLFNRGDRSS